ncbi:Uncharacterised protein [Salmonella enterica subsp. salamae]|nr:Uncharacterised protein [Salmonella enterica subsp. salamae]
MLLNFIMPTVYLSKTTNHERLTSSHELYSMNI